MTTFKFTRISHSFIGEVAATLINGESTVLLGPRFCRKRYVMEEVLRVLQEHDADSVIAVCDIFSQGLSSFSKLADTMTSAVRAAGFDPPTAPDGDVFSAVDWLQEKKGRPLYLLVANVDGMAHHLAAAFLQNVWRRVSEHRLVVLLSGEFDFRDLMHGFDSRIAIAHHYFVQGLDADVFAETFEQYSRGITIPIQNPESVCERLFRLTGGTGHLLRLLLTSSWERRAIDGSWGNPIVAEDFTEAMGLSGSPRAYWASVVRYPTQLILGTPECWSDLEMALGGRINEISVADSAPGPLEFAGVAIRDIHRRRLDWASPILRCLLHQYYSPRRLADLYAHAGKWEKAFQHYERIPNLDRLRPFDHDDRFDTEHAVDALCSTLHAEVESGPEHLRNLLMKGCRLILGLHDCGFWTLEREWVGVKSFSPPPDMKDVPSLLPVGEHLSEGWLSLPAPYEGYAVAAIFPAMRSGRYMAIVAGDFQNHTSISVARERLVRKLLAHFLAAHTRAGQMENDRRRVSLRDPQRELLSSIGDSLSKNFLDVKQVLRRAGEALHKLDYYRVQFCFVDTKGERIKGVVDLNDDPNHVDVAAMTDFPLRPPTADIQPYVVYTKQYKIVPDPHTEPLINPLVLAAAKLRPLAIVPILNRNQAVLGTIHVERNDSDVPTLEEVQGLLFFGRQLASIIEQSERVRLLQNALDKIPHPVALVGLDGGARYANLPAGDLFAIDAGWRDLYPETGAGLPVKWGDKVQKDITQCLAGSRVVHHHTGIGTRPTYRGTVLCDQINNWQGEQTAALLHVEDLNYLETVFEVFGRVARSNDTESAYHNLLKSCLALGVRWARLYFIDPEDPNVLVSKLGVGEGEEPYETDFEGKVRFRRGGDSDFGWWAIDLRSPQVFYFLPEGVDREFYRTEAGLEAMVVTRPPETPYAPKVPNTFWIDLPLCTPDGVLGKVTLDCPPQFLPEKFEMLRVLSENAAALLGAFREKERMMHRRDEYIERSAAERVMASIAHNLNTRVAALPGLLTLYKAAEHDTTRLPNLNEKFRFVLESVLNTVARSKVLLAPINLKPKRFDLFECLSNTLGSAHPDGLWTLECQRPFDVEWDSHQISSAFLELIHNSQQASESSAIVVNVESVDLHHKERVRIVYEDSGPGIPDEFKSNIFEHFFSRKPEGHAGTGLGLWFVRRVMEAHEGTIIENGQLGVGVRFVIELPRWCRVTDAR